MHLKYSAHCKPNLQLIWIELTQHQMRVSSGRATCSHATSARSSNIPGWKTWLRDTPSAMYLHNDIWNQNALIFWDACAYPTSSLAGGYVSSRPGLPCWALNKNVVCGFKRKQQTCCWVLGCLGCTRITVWSSVRAFSRIMFYHATWPEFSFR